MSKLINITQVNNEQMVNARELHRRLKVGRDFSTWLRQRIDRYDFIEGEDYFVREIFAPRNGGAKTSRGGHNRIDYTLTLNMAKELCMVQENAIGRKIRRYFIEMEKVARAGALQVPEPVIIDGIECVSYMHWLLQHGFSTTSGSVHGRWQRYPDQFLRNNGIVYISVPLANYLLAYKNASRRPQLVPLNQLHIDFRVCS